VKRGVFKVKKVKTELVILKKSMFIGVSEVSLRNIYYRKKKIMEKGRGLSFE